MTGKVAAVIKKNLFSNKPKIEIAIVKYHQPRTKFNFPEGMPIEDQSDDDDGFWA